MKKDAFVIILVVIFLLFVPTPSASATSGALRRASIITCPNGKKYGQHGADSHWHEAEPSNTTSGWTAIGPEIHGDPCQSNIVTPQSPAEQESAPTPPPATTPNSEPEPDPQQEPEPINNTQNQEDLVNPSQNSDPSPITIPNSTQTQKSPQPQQTSQVPKTDSTISAENSRQTDAQENTANEETALEEVIAEQESTEAISSEDEGNVATENELNIEPSPTQNGNKYSDNSSSDNDNTVGDGAILAFIGASNIAATAGIVYALGKKHKK